MAPRSAEVTAQLLVKEVQADEDEPCGDEE
jgi:hypothetical protein